MGQRVTKVSPMTVGEVYEQHLSTPPTPSTNRAVHHPHPRDETPVGAGGGGGEEEGGGGGEGRGEEGGEEGGEEEKERKEAERVEEKRKSKKWWRRLRSFFRAAQKHPPESSSGQGAVEQKQDEREKRKVAWAGRSSDDYIFSRYTVGDQLGKGGSGVVYEGRRLDDDLKVALKYVTKTENTECIFIPDHPNPLPKEIALTILANKGPSVPEIIRLLDWTDHPDHFVMVLECPSPCENLHQFIRRHGGSLDEETTRQIMRQAAHAANMCCLRRVLHRDVKLQNLLINRETSEVKLIDFGCGDILRRTPYRSYSGTAAYSPPEYHSRGKYYGGPATVWSLGILMFTLLCGRFPCDYDLFLLEYKQRSKPGLSKGVSSMRSQVGDLVWGKLCPTTGLRSSHKTTPVGVSHAALRLAGCIGRRFHPSSRLCVLRGEQAMCSVLRLGLRKQYLRLANTRALSLHLHSDRAPILCHHASQRYQRGSCYGCSTPGIGTPMMLLPPQRCKDPSQNWHQRLPQSTATLGSNFPLIPISSVMASWSHKCQLVPPPHKKKFLLQPKKVL
ncbi:Serine/threonine-protein kinase pim-2 [Labeo rohita]|uniref:non-specific serine/threonine protein kinase n=1 Tax=Labeo rohita TaxID=84645 RepID=A0ABQ8LD00_LABRO|nr:Serine/threonine-protein kinase pim-2 [Labeo rohita]